MNSIDILKFFGEMGIRYQEDEIPKAIAYIDRMIEDGRFMISIDKGKPHTIILFSICNNYEPFYKKGTWDYLSHFRDGNTVYIEKAVSKHFSRRLRMFTEEALVETYPKLEGYVWHRWGRLNDRILKGKRRLYGEYSDQDSNGRRV